MIASKPSTFNSDLAHLPAALIPLTVKPRWVVWRWEYRKGEWTKPPRQAAHPGKWARSNDPETWGTYGDAVAAVVAGSADGIGYMLKGDELTAGDLDHCRDPKTGMIDPWAQAIIDRARKEGAYIEVTVSGTGMRVLGKSGGPELHRRWTVEGERDGAGVEVFRDTSRFITVSGREIGHCEQLPETTLIDEIVLQYDGGRGKKTVGTGDLDFNNAGPQNDDIDDVIVNGVPEGKRSEAFQRVVAHLAEHGLGIDEIEMRLTQHPNGIAAKYEGRLRKEIERSFSKWRARHDNTGTTNTWANGGTAPDPDDEPLQWDSVDKSGFPKPSCANARTAVRALNISCRYDEFHDRLMIEGSALDSWAGEVSDYSCQVIRDLISRKFRFDPGKENLRDGIVQLCMRHRFDPVVGYLNSLTWDEKPRLDTWLSTYLGAEDTPLNRAIGRIALVAAVRRARQPGCKFDQIIVIEGDEGILKSSAIELMAGSANFSDQSILGMTDQKQQECLRGVWLYEIADLSGMRRAETEHVKAFASRTSDRARPAYGHGRIDLKRRGILFATTNDDTYLKSQTGNRRFWPFGATHIDFEALRRDRDQLWAEAAVREAEGISLVLPVELWSDARIEQDKRLVADPFDELLADVKGDVYPTVDGLEERVASRSLMIDVLGFKADRVSDMDAKRIAYCMRRLGWKGPQKMRIRDKNLPVKGYARSVQTEANKQQEKNRPKWARDNN